MAGCLLIAGAAEAGQVPVDIHTAFQADSARETWRRNNLKSYRFDITLTCYCAAHGRFLVSVSDGAVSGVERVGNADTALPPATTVFETVDGLFAIIDHHLDSRPDAIELRLDRHLGYPAFFSVNPRYGVADDELSLTIHSLTPLPPR